MFRPHSMGRGVSRWTEPLTAAPVPMGLCPLPGSPLQAQAQLQESSQKLDLLRLALEQLLEGLPPAHPLRGRVARELRTAVSGTPRSSGMPVKPAALTGSQEPLPLQSTPSFPEKKGRGGEELGGTVPIPALPLSSCGNLASDIPFPNLSLSHL